MVDGTVTKPFSAETIPPVPDLTKHFSIFLKYRLPTVRMNQVKPVSELCLSAGRYLHATEIVDTKSHAEHEMIV
jgi:hypothetical protein